MAEREQTAEHPAVLCCVTISTLLQHLRSVVCCQLLLDFSCFNYSSIANLLEILAISGT